MQQGSIDWNLVWAAVGAIGGILGAFATTAAVIVALRQTKYQNRKRLKVEFSDNVFLMRSEGPARKEKEYVALTVTNVGNRSVRLEQWLMRLPDGKTSMILCDDSVIGRALAPTWPMLLEPEQQTTRYWEKKLFYGYLAENEQNFAKTWKKIKMIVKDSTGRKYQIRTKGSLRDYVYDAKAYLKGETR